MKTNEELLRKEEEEISKTLALSLEEYNAKQIKEQEKAQEQSLLHTSSFGMEEDWDEMLQEAIRQSIIGTDGMSELNRNNGFTRNSVVDYNDSHFNIVKNHFIKMSYYLCNTYDQTKNKDDVIDNKLFWNDIYKYYKGIFLIIKNYIVCLIKRAQAINDYVTSFECSGSSSNSKRRRRRLRRKHSKSKNRRRGNRGYHHRNNSSTSSSSSSFSSSSSYSESSDSECDDSDTSKSSNLSIRSLEDIKVAYAPINYSTKQYCKWLRKGNKCSKLNDHVYLYYLLDNMNIYEDSIEIHNLVFGVNNYKYANKTDIAKWFNHNLTFNEHENINFGLRQFLNGPCGLISSIQGYLIIILLFNHKYNFLWGSDYFNVLKTNPDFMNFTNDLMGTGENVDTSFSESNKGLNGNAKENKGSENIDKKKEGNINNVKNNSMKDTNNNVNNNTGGKRKNKKKDIEDADSDKELLALVCDNIKDLKYYCLVESLAYILYQCTDKSHYIIAFVLPECYDFYCYIDKKREDEGYYRDLKKVAVYYKEFTNIKDVIIFYLEHFILFSCATGVISFLYSVILTRGIDNIRNDMDDTNHPLIGIYGHCSQELVNLLLTGRACSNVFDNTSVLNTDQNNETHVSVCEDNDAAIKKVSENEKGKENKNFKLRSDNREDKKEKGKQGERDLQISNENEEGKEKEKTYEISNGNEKEKKEKEEKEGKGEKEEIEDYKKKENSEKQNGEKGEKKENRGKDNIILKGISKRPLIGLLTDFEAFKYCEVGNFYKYPVYPIWVISSSSHYTVLFSLNIRNSKCTSEELIKKQMDTVWKKYDKDNNKYIDSQCIPEFLKELKVTEEYKSMFDNYSNDLGVLLYAEFKQFYMDLKKKEINSLKRLDPPKDKYFYLYDAKELPENSIHYFHLKEVDYDVSHQNYLSFFNTRWPNNTVELLNCRKTAKGK